MNMREIKFRGRNEKGYWHYGNLCICDNGDYVIGNCSTGSNIFFRSKVIPETVGQFTSLKDKNNKEIYEGDIILVHEKYQWTFEVKYSDSELSYGMFIDNIMEGNLNEFTDNENVLEVIGNIYENTELLSEV